MKYFSRIAFLLLFITASVVPANSDDTCIFFPTDNDVPPSIVLYIDNSGDMEQARWISDFDNTTDWTPADHSVEAIENPVTGTGFFKEHGYGIYAQGGGAGTDYFLAPFEITSENVMEMDTSNMIQGVPSGDDLLWTFNGKTIALPVESLSNALAEFGAPNADPVTAMRYSTNYLNYLFFSGEYTGDGSDLIEENRFYSAKKALARVILETENKALFSLWYHTNDDGATQNKPLGYALEEDADGNFSYDPDFLNSLNGMQTYDFSPLAEGLAEVAGYYNSANSHGENYDCAQNFVIMISSGMSSKDLGDNTDAHALTAEQYEPDFLADYDGDDLEIGEGWIIEDNSLNNIDDDGDGEVDEDDEKAYYEIPVGYEGSTYLDDIAYYIYNNDVGYADGYQNIITYTIGFMGDHVSNLLLINTANNGNGFFNLYNTADENYGKYYYDASTEDKLVDALTDAINSILERTTVFAAPVVPVTRTTSGDRIYMSFFTPKAGNFWEGNVVKFGLNEANEIIDSTGELATEENGALKDDAVPFWSTMDWAADPGSSNPASNGILYSERPIYTYLGDNENITALANAFININISAELLGTPVDYTADEVIDYIRGADILDEDEDGIVTENRAVITGDVLHSEPAVYEFIHTEGVLTLGDKDGSFIANELVVGTKGGRAYVNTATGSTLTYERLLSPFSKGETITGSESGASATLDELSDPTMIFFGANDGMLHAVQDSNGEASWSFIPPNQLNRLKDILEGDEHLYFVDGSPKIYLIDDDGDGFIDADGDDDNDGMPDSDPDRVILVCGERKGSSSYFALDVTYPHEPLYLWRISPVNDTEFAEPLIYSELGESWSEPRFGKVKRNDTDTEGVDAMIIGGGYSDDNSAGTSIYIIELLTGNLLKEFSFGLDYSFASTVNALDIDDNGFLDKFYVGDLGGNMYRVGNFKEADLTPLVFPDTDENISNWVAERIFSANTEIPVTDRKFFYPPSVALEYGYDLIFMGTGDREDPCDPTTGDGVFVVKDTHESLVYATPDDLINITDPTDPDYSIPELDGDDLGWYYLLADGEKVLAKGIVFSGVYYFTTFTPNDDPCMPGGIAKLYAMDYKTGLANEEFFENFDTDGPGIIIGGGIPSRPVLVINDNPDETKLFVSVGATNVDPESDSQDAGIISTDPGANETFSYIWWRDWVIPSP